MGKVFRVSHNGVEICKLILTSFKSLNVSAAQSKSNIQAFAFGGFFNTRFSSFVIGHYSSLKIFSRSRGCSTKALRDLRRLNPSKSVPQITQLDTFITFSFHSES